MNSNIGYTLLESDIIEAHTTNSCNKVQSVLNSSGFIASCFYWLRELLVERGKNPKSINKPLMKFLGLLNPLTSSEVSFEASYGIQCKSFSGYKINHVLEE